MFWQEKVLSDLKLLLISKLAVLIPDSYNLPEQNESLFPSEGQTSERKQILISSSLQGVIKQKKKKNPISNYCFPKEASIWDVLETKMGS